MRATGPSRCRHRRFRGVHRRTRQGTNLAPSAGQRSSSRSSSALAVKVAGFPQSTFRNLRHRRHRLCHHRHAPARLQSIYLRNSRQGRRPLPALHHRRLQTNPRRRRTAPTLRSRGHRPPRSGLRRRPRRRNPALAHLQEPARPGVDSGWLSRFRARLGTQPAGLPRHRLQPRHAHDLYRRAKRPLRLRCQRRSHRPDDLRRTCQRRGGRARFSLPRGRSNAPPHFFQSAERAQRNQGSATGAATPAAGSGKTRPRGIQVSRCNNGAAWPQSPTKAPPQPDCKPNKPPDQVCPRSVSSRSKPTNREIA